MAFSRGNNRGGFGGGRDRGRSFGGDRGGFSRDRPQRREMFTINCTQCGKEAQVPFKPTGSKPVLCSDCFSKDGGDRRNSGSSNNSEDIKQINAKLDKIIAILKDLELEYDEDSKEPSEEDSDDEDEEN